MTVTTTSAAMGPIQCQRAFLFDLSSDDRLPSRVLAPRAARRLDSWGATGRESPPNARLARQAATLLGRSPAATASAWSMALRVFSS